MNADRLKELARMMTSTDDKMVKEAVSEVAVLLIQAYFEIKKKEVEALTRMGDALTLIAELKSHDRS